MIKDVAVRVNDVALRGATALWRWGGARWFLPAVLVGYLLSAIFFSVVVFIPRLDDTVDGVTQIVRMARVPDEFRHIGNIYYYAHLPLSAGPFITDAPLASLWLGEIERFPSYLYYYVMSFPLRGLEAIGVGYEATIITLRILTSLTGLAALVLGYRILRLVGSSAIVAGWATVALALTGRFVWQSAGVSYDTPSMALFLLFLLAGVHVLQTASARWYLVFIASAALVSITKYTFMPFVVFGAVVLTVFVIVARRRSGDAGFATSWRIGFARARAGILALSVLAAVSLALFAERIVVNYLRFGDAEPDCDVINTAAECTTYFDIYRRNTSVRADYLAQIADGSRGPQQYAPFSYTGTWADIYYQSTFFYRGAGSGYLTWSVDNWVIVLGSLSLVAAIAFALVAARRLLTSPPRVFIAGVSALYIVGVYVFNLRTYLSVDKYYAHSGRYLLPIAVFAIAAALVGMLWAFRRMNRAYRGYVAIAAVLVIVALVLSHNSISSFFAYADKPSWFSDVSRDLMMRVATKLHG